MTQMAVFKTALEAFHEDCGRLPSTSEGLSALIARPASLSEKQWRGPYLMADRIPKDPWGHDYVYRFPAAKGTNAFDLYSLGPDGVTKSGGNDADDISAWPQWRAP